MTFPTTAVPAAAAGTIVPAQKRANPTGPDEHPTTGAELDANPTGPDEAPTTGAGLDVISRRLYASAGAGLVLAIAAALILRSLDWPLHSKTGQIYAALVVLGAAMFVGGGTTGSIRPRSHLGGDR